MEQVTLVYGDKTSEEHLARALDLVDGDAWDGGYMNEIVAALIDYLVHPEKMDQKEQRREENWAAYQRERAEYKAKLMAENPAEP